MTQRWDVAVVGGGLAGLAAAASAADRGVSVVLIDRDERGGRAATDAVGRFLFNRGAHALYKGGAGAAVLGRVGIKPKGHRPAYLNGRLRVDDSTAPFFGAKVLGQRARLEAIRVLLGLRRLKPESLAGISAGSWLDELDVSVRARQFLELGVRTATYSADPYAISADVAIDSLRIGTWPGVIYLDGGWEQLVGGLHGALKQRKVTVTHDRITAIRPDGDRVTVAADGRDISASQVVVATGGPDACASLLPHRPATWDGLGPPSRIACLDLGLATKPKISLLVAIDRPLYLSRHCPPADLAPRGASVVQLMRYLRPDESLSADDARRELAEHARLAGIDPDGAEECRYLHEMVACSAMPVPERGGLRGRPPVHTDIPGVFVAGDWVGPVGHLADASLASGEAAGAAAADASLGIRSKIAA
jgi:phytoene dehydrogenase-like protein